MEYDTVQMKVAQIQIKLTKMCKIKLYSTIM